jgi:hypothetical protein
MKAMEAENELLREQLHRRMATNAILKAERRKLLSSITGKDAT